ncbi:MAG: hypothetical protein WD042_18260 [Phycisphaeraceae bacterium]
MDQPKRNVSKSLAMAGIGLAALAYLLNPGWGIFELLPDNLPIIGNLDEAGAALLVLGTLRYFGLDLITPFQRKPPA